MRTHCQVHMDTWRVHKHTYRPQFIPDSKLNQYCGLMAYMYCSVQYNQILRSGPYHKSNSSLWLLIQKDLKCQICQKIEVNFKKTVYFESGNHVDTPRIMKITRGWKSCATVPLVYLIFLTGPSVIKILQATKSNLAACQLKNVLAAALFLLLSQ